MLRVSFGFIAVVSMVYLLWNLWGPSISFDLAFSYSSINEPVRMDAGKGYWYAVYSDPDSYHDIAHFCKQYSNDTGGRDLLSDHQIDLNQYTYIVCFGTKLYRFARSPYVDNGTHIGKAYVKLDDKYNVNVYRISKIAIDVGDPHAGSNDFTVLLPDWFLR